MRAKALKWAIVPVAALAIAAVVKADDAKVGGPVSLKTVVAPKGWILKRDDENFKQGPYVAFAGDWSVKFGKVSLRRGVDYADHMVINPADFPRNTVIHWQWPGYGPKSGVYGYMHIAYGNYAGGPPMQPVKPVRIADMGNVTTQFAVDLTGDPANFNLLSETFLTAAPGDFKTRGLEVGFLPTVSANGRMFFNASPQLGNWTDPHGRVWRVAIKGEYCMLIPANGTFTSGSLDFGAALKWLVSQGRLTGQEWFNGLAIGVEPVQGSGTMTIKQWRVLYN